MHAKPSRATEPVDVERERRDPAGIQRRQATYGVIDSDRDRLFFFCGGNFFFLCVFFLENPSRLYFTLFCFSFGGLLGAKLL
jgi:hypothetical protein